MGNSYYRNVTQWAKGEYAGANNTEDQLQVMQNYGLTYFTDDHGDTAETATQLAAGSAISESGFIERNTDVDVFRLEAEAGIVSIGVTPAPLGPNLKILAEFLDFGGNVLISSSKSDLSAAIRTTIPAGTYYLRISGVGSGDPATTGYSNYGSLGQYVLEGTTGSSAIPPTALILPGELSGEAPLGFWFTGSDSTDDGTITSYAWNFGDGSTSSYPNPYHEFTSAGVFTVTLTVTDDDGLTGSASATVTVTKQQVHVKSIWLTPTSSSTAVSATATVMIANSYDTPISGAIVTGSWSGVVQETLSAVTDMSAVATFKSPQSLVSGTFTFTVTDVSALGCTYNVQQNNQTSASIFGSPIDTIAPSITIIAPQEGAKVAGTVSISVDASDDVGVIKVALYVDGRLTAISTIPPFKTRWDGRMSKGGHTIRTVAYDAAGNSSSSPTVTVYKR
jgi:PKD repeat protein